MMDKIFQSMLYMTMHCA